MTTVRLTPPASDPEWQAYHAIRRRVLFELRGRGDAYDDRHPDEHRPGHFPLLLWHTDTPIGTIRVDIAGVVATFRRVAIRDDLQRQGFGRQLMHAAEAFARSRGCSRIDSFVDHGAVTFYEKCGFVRATDAAGHEATVPMTKALR